MFAMRLLHNANTLSIESPYRILASPIELEHIVDTYHARASSIAQFVYLPPKEISLRVTDVLNADYNHIIAF